MKLTVHFASAEPISQSASPSHLKTEKTGNVFAPLWEILAAKLKVLFPDGDDTGTFIVPAFNVRSQVLSIKGRRNGVRTPLFKLAPLGNGQVFAFTASDLHVPGIPDDMLQQVISQASTANVMAALSPPRFFAAWRVEAPFSAVFLSDGPCNLYSLWFVA